MSFRKVFGPLVFAGLLSLPVFAQDAGVADEGQQVNPHHVKNKDRRHAGTVDDEQARKAQEDNPHSVDNKDRRHKGKAVKGQARKAQEDNPDNPENKDRPLPGSGKTTATPEAAAPDAGR